jgi:glycosyltransferase involved in cell wall biosynthesis
VAKRNRGSMQSRPDMIQVLQVVPTHSLGGALLTAMLIAERLDPDQYATTLVAGDTAGPEGSLLEDMQRRGIEVELLPSLCRSPHPWKDPRAIFELRNVLRRRRPHILHTHGSKTKQLIPLATRLARVPIRIAHIHGWEWYPARSRLGRRVFATASRISARYYHALVAGSDAMRQEGLKAGVGRPEQYRVVPYPVDTGAFNPDAREATRRQVRAELKLPPEAPVVVSVMRLAPQKAPFDLIAAAEIVLKARQDVHFLVVGGGELEEQMRRDIEARRLDGRMRMLGVRRDVPALMKASDVFALSSVWEAMGIVYLEASAVGLPCVGTEVGGAPEAVEDGVTGLLVPPRNPQALARAILKVVGDPELAADLGAAGREKALGFAQDRYVQQMEDVYRGLLEECRLRGVRVPQVTRESAGARELGRARAGTS